MVVTLCIPSHETVHSIPNGVRVGYWSDLVLVRYSRMSSFSACRKKVRDDGLLGSIAAM